MSTGELFTWKKADSFSKVLSNPRDKTLNLHKLKMKCSIKKKKKHFPLSVLENEEFVVNITDKPKEEELQSNRWQMRF